MVSVKAATALHAVATITTAAIMQKDIGVLTFAALFPLRLIQYTAGLGSQSSS